MVCNTVLPMHVRSCIRKLHPSRCILLAISKPAIEHQKDHHSSGYRHWLDLHEFIQAALTYATDLQPGSPLEKDPMDPKSCA